MSIIIYLDESGDLGWKFDAPFRRGGSSRYLTIAAACVPPEKKHLPKRLIKALYEKSGWAPDREVKWSGMSQPERLEFARQARRLCDQNLDICLHGIVVKKQNVMQHIRVDGNKLYNYMIGLCLLDRMATHDVVTLVPDPRTIKVKSGNSLHDYLQMGLWFNKKSATNLLTLPVDSKSCRGLQFVDMLAGLVQSRYEDNDYACYNLLSARIAIKELYF